MAKVGSKKRTLDELAVADLKRAAKRQAQIAARDMDAHPADAVASLKLAASLLESATSYQPRQLTIEEQAAK